MYWRLGLLALASLSFTQECFPPSGFTQHDDGKYYLEVSESATIDDGMDLCQSRGATLPRIKSEAEFRTISGLIKKATWLDLYNIRLLKSLQNASTVMNGTLRWGDGTTLYIEPWMQPQSMNIDGAFLCFLIKPGKSFLDAECKLEVSILCQFDCNSVDTCPEGIEKPANSKERFGSYYTYTNADYFYKSRQECLDNNMNLATFRTEMEYLALLFQRHFFSEDHFVGLIPRQQGTQLCTQEKVEFCPLFQWTTPEGNSIFVPQGFMSPSQISLNNDDSEPNFRPVVQGPSTSYHIVGQGHGNKFPGICMHPCTKVKECALPMLFKRFDWYNENGTAIVGTTIRYRKF